MKRVMEFIANQITYRTDKRTPDQRAQHVPSKEAEKRHPGRPRHRTGHKSHARDKARHEDRFGAVGLEEKLQSIVTLAGKTEVRGQPHQEPLSSRAAQDKSAAVARNRAGDRCQIDEAQIKDSAS